MFRILDRYLLMEVVTTFLATLSIFLLVMVGGLVTDTLSKIARGKIPAELLASQIGLRSLEALTLLIPLAAFLAVMLCFSRLYRDGEMAVIGASGIGVRGLLRPLMVLAVPLMLLLAALSLWLAPWGARLSDQMIDEAARSLVISGLDPGRFQELPGRRAVVYVADIDPEGRRLQGLFVQGERDGRFDIVVAQRGELQVDEEQRRFLILEDGVRTEGVPGSGEFRVLEFARNELRLGDFESGTSEDARRGVPSASLWASGQAQDWGELHWRLASPLSALVLILLAVPLSRSRPREGRYGKIFIGILLYIIYVNLLALGRSWMDQEQFSSALGLWWVHLPLAALALGLLARDWRSRMPRTAA